MRDTQDSYLKNPDPGRSRNSVNNQADSHESLPFINKLKSEHSSKRDKNNTSKVDNNKEDLKKLYPDHEIVEIKDNVFAVMQLIKELDPKKRVVAELENRDRKHEEKANRMPAPVNYIKSDTEPDKSEHYDKVNESIDHFVNKSEPKNS